MPFILFGLSINVNYYNSSKSHEILTLYNSFPFKCSKQAKNIICSFDQMPSTSVFKAKTRFFNIKPKFVSNKFFLEIICKKNCILISKSDNLYNNPLLTLKEKNSAKKWIIIANKKQFSNQKQKGLNFYFHNSPKIYVGAIDEKQNPINVSNTSKDVMDYFEILKKFHKGRNISIDADDYIKNYPNSMFLSDILYMKMVCLDKTNDSEDLIQIAKKWIKKYSFDEKLPNVLLLMAKNYSKMGFLSDASYFFNRIITEYPDTKESRLAMIYLADQLYMSGDSKKAMKLYERVLFSSKNIDIASLAAVRLATRYVNSGEFKKAYQYYKKIYSANKSFLLKDRQKAYELAKLLANHQMYSLAIDITGDLFKKTRTEDDLYEPFLYDLALWSYDNKDYKISIKYINLYLNKFPFGDYSDQVKSLRDKVLFNIPDKNLTRMLNNINKIIKKYKATDIAKKALVKKINILYKLKKYRDILNLNEKIKNLPKNLFPEKKEFISKVEKKYAICLLNKAECAKAVTLIKKYHIILNKKYDEKIYQCAMKVYAYNTAFAICNKYLDTPDNKIFIKWTKRALDALWGMKDYKKIVLGVDDLCGVMKKGCYKYKVYQFFAYWNLHRYKKALEVAKRLDKTKDIRNTDAFIKIVDWALKNNNNLLAATYAKKIIDLQNKFKVYPYSPFVEFTYVKYTQNKKAAIKVLKDMLNRVSGENKARAYYFLANLTKNKKYINECLKVKNSKLWKGICKDAKSLF